MLQITVQHLQELLMHILHDNFAVHDASTKYDHLRRHDQSQIVAQLGEIEPHQPPHPVGVVKLFNLCFLDPVATGDGIVSDKAFETVLVVWTHTLEV